MFKKLFGKKEADKEVKKEEFPQDWASYFCRVEDKPGSIRLNLALREIAPIKHFENRVWFSVKLQNPDENGFTTNEEFPVICDIEDKIWGALETMGAISVGALKTNGALDLYSYINDIDSLEEVIRSVMKDFPNYNYATDFKADSNWSDYFDFLFPGEYEYQTISNQKVLYNLEKSGDNPEVEREVDHWLYFKSEENRTNFIAKAEEKGYKILSKRELKEGENEYQLNLSKVSQATSSAINENVWELIVLAKEENGDYDGWGCPIMK